MGDISTMGVDIEVYRARLGLNDLKMKSKFKIRKHQPYNYKGYNNGIDIHLCCFVFLLVYFGLIYTTIMTQVYIENNFATSILDKCSIEPLGDKDYTRGTVPSTCPMYGV